MAQQNLPDVNYQNPVPVTGTITTTPSGTQTVQGTVTALFNNVVSILNSSTTPLGSNGVFTGGAESILGYVAIDILCFADQAGTIQFQASPDGTHWDHLEDAIPVAANVALAVQKMAEGQYYRLVYTNGAVAQGAFRLQTLLRQVPQTSEIQPIIETLGDQTDALITKGVIVGKTTGGGGGYVSVKVNPSGTLTADVSNSTGLTGTVTANAGTNLNTSALALDSTVAKDGTDITTPTAMPAGGVGIRGWLSAIWTKLNGSLAVTGTFWQATQPVSNTTLTNLNGTWGYNAGTSGTLVLTGGKRVLSITAIAEELAASITINAGDTITLPYGSTDKVSSSIEIKPVGNLVNPTLVFTSTAAYFVEYVS